MIDHAIEMRKSATISDCGRYRYLLRRHWDEQKMAVSFVMLNPSTADADKDDPTIRSCCRLARSWNYGGIAVVNLFAWRATDPRELTKADDPVGPENDEYIRMAVRNTDFTICAWGAYAAAGPRIKPVVAIIRQYRDFAHCLGTTKAGHPKHPLYIKTGTTPELYTP